MEREFSWGDFRGVKCLWDHLSCYNNMILIQNLICREMPRRKIQGPWSYKNIVCFVGSTQLYPLSKNNFFYSLFTLKLSEVKEWEITCLCLSLGNAPLSIHVMNSTYFPKKWNYNNSKAFHVTNCSSELLASLPLSLTISHSEIDNRHTTYDG